MDTVVRTVLVGIGATAIVDFFTVLRTRVFGVRAPDYGLVGRWLAHMRRGRFQHDAIARAEPIRNERVIGWSAHYMIGIAFAALLPALFGSRWLVEPTLLPALAVGLATVAAPFLLMQPGMGAGLAGRRTRQPGAVRTQSVITHAVFGFGLYAAAVIVARL